MIKEWQSFIKESIQPSLFSEETFNSFCYLDKYGAIAISGPDAEKLLQGQFTCDVKLASPGSFTYGAYCNTKGRVIAFFKLFYWQNKYIITLPLELVENTIKEIQKYILISNAKVEDYSNNLIQNYIVGENAVAETIDILGLNLNDNGIMISDEFIANLNSKNNKNIKINFASLATAKSFWQELGKQFKASTPELYEASEIRNKTPEIYLATAGEFLPHNIDLPELKAVSFDKGCYRGQEIIARMEYKSNKKKNLEYFTLPINSDSEISVNQKIKINGDKEVKILRYVKNISSEKFEILAETNV